jgi:hypothetical protein
LLIPHIFAVRWRARRAIRRAPGGGRPRSPEPPRSKGGSSGTDVASAGGGRSLPFPRRAPSADEATERGLGSERWTSRALATGEPEPEGGATRRIARGSGFEEWAELDAAAGPFVVHPAHDRVIERSERRFAALLVREPVVAPREVCIGAR